MFVSLNTNKQIENRKTILKYFIMISQHNLKVIIFIFLALKKCILAKCWNGGGCAHKKEMTSY